MTKNDLKQISELLDKGLKENNKKLFKKIDEKIDKSTEENNKKIDGKFEENNKKIDGKFEENNKKIDEKIDKLEENIMVATKRGFDEVDSRFEKVEKKLTDVKQDVKKIKDVQENIYQRICDQTDNEVKDLQLDMDKVKYIHKKEWAKLPPTYEISKALAEDGLKKKL